MRKHFLNYVLCFCLGLLLFFVIGLLPACNKTNEQPQKAKEVTVPTPPPLTATPAPAVESHQGPLDLRTAIIQVAQQTIPAVVHIEVTERQTAPNPFRSL